MEMKQECEVLGIRFERSAAIDLTWCWADCRRMRDLLEFKIDAEDEKG